MNELYKIEEGQLIIAKNIIEAIKNCEKQKKEAEELEKNLREKLLEAMEKYGQDKWVSPDETLKITYTPENEVSTFDTTRFKAEHQDLYFEYQKTSPRKASIRITVKDEKTDEVNNTK